MDSILVVEDEILISCVVEDALSDAGLHVAAAHSGEEACSRLTQEARTFAALVTDINLGPGPSGFDVACLARELNPEIQVVYISGHAAHLDQARVGDALVVPKPFDPDRLARHVLRLLAREDGDRAAVDVGRRKAEP